MASATWPASLQQKPEIDGYQYRYGNNVIRTTVDVGPAKTRRRQTAAPNRATYVIYCTDAQRSTLDTFYVGTLQSGAQAFNWHDYTRDVAVEARFVSPPVFRPFGVDWEVSLDLEFLP